MKLYKDIQLEVNGKEYSIAYKTKLGFVSSVHIYEITNKQPLGTGGCIGSCKELECKLIKASTLKDWLRYRIYVLLWNTRKNFSKE